MPYKNYIDLVDTFIKHIYKETDCFAETQDEAYKLANYLELRIKEVSRHLKEGGSYEES
jgi:hypothetical protein